MSQNHHIFEFANILNNIGRSEEFMLKVQRKIFISVLIILLPCNWLMFSRKMTALSTPRLFVLAGVQDCADYGPVLVQIQVLPALHGVECQCHWSIVLQALGVASLGDVFHTESQREDCISFVFL